MMMSYGAAVCVVCTLCVLGFLKVISRNITGEKPKLYFTESPLSRHILSQVQRLHHPFQPALWSSNAHIQTILSRILPAPDVIFERHYVNLPDCGILALDWCKNGAELGVDNPVLLVVPDRGRAVSDVGSLCHLALARGLRPVVFNRRGHGNSFVSVAKFQAPGDPKDLRSALEEIRGDYPQAPVVGVGYGEGAGLLVSYTGESEFSSILSACICISPVYDLESFYKRTLGCPYSCLLLQDSKRLVRPHATKLAKVTDVTGALASSNMADFDTRLFCPMYGLTCEEYFERNNPANWGTEKIAIPTLYISALDDPVCGSDVIDYSRFRNSDLMLAAASSGGHCGFLEGKWMERWADKLALDYIEAVMDFIRPRHVPSVV